MKKREPIGWTPVRKGKIYCSPLCGGNCTWVAYRQAVWRAKVLCKGLDGQGWEPRVWENLGWHYQARNGHLGVYPLDGGRYMAYCSMTEGGSGTPCQWSDPNKDYKDPNEAVRMQIAIVAAEVARDQAVLAAITQAVAGRGKP